MHCLCTAEGSKEAWYLLSAHKTTKNVWQFEVVIPWSQIKFYLLSSLIVVSFCTLGIQACRSPDDTVLDRVFGRMTDVPYADFDQILNSPKLRYLSLLCRVLFLWRKKCPFLADWFKTVFMEILKTGEKAIYRHVIEPLWISSRKNREAIFWVDGAIFLFFEVLFWISCWNGWLGFRHSCVHSSDSLWNLFQGVSWQKVYAPFMEQTGNK